MVGFCRRTIPTRVGRTRAFRTLNAIYPDHPHASGENLNNNGACDCKSGPSPREWGEPPVHEDQSTRQRTIPTRVGRTRHSAPCPWWQSDHPHASGENRLKAIGDGERVGPSPREWGERGAVQGRGRVHRTIPTRVGRTFSLRRRPSCKTDHPHASGENRLQADGIGNDDGPSPRDWGELGCPTRRSLWRRTIPTRVGRTEPPVRLAYDRSDHPRASGENRW